MAVENKYQSTTVEAGEDLNSGVQYHGFALNDGKLANSGDEASGILMNKPIEGRFAQIGIKGEMKFAAGGAVTKDDPLTVTTSGWFAVCGSGYYICGKAKKAVTSGSIGTGLFDFTAPVYAFSSSFVA